MKKRIISAILLIVMCFSSFNVMADETLIKAEVLYNLGLLKGTGGSFSKEALELSRNATRAEVCTTIVRMLGKEEKAVYQKNAHPFTDVPQWASDNIGWLYENYLVNGASDIYFGAEDIATVQQFSTMLLRVLGFSDAKGDFSYDNASSFALSYGLLTSDMIAHYELSREAMIIMCYNALKLNIKNSGRKLIRKLCDEGAVREDIAKESGLLKDATISDMFPDVAENLGEITVDKMENQFRIILLTPVEEYGVRVYVMPEGGALREVKLNLSDGPYFKKGKISYMSGAKAGYINELYVYGLDLNKTHSFIVIKTSSEGEYYKTLGKSGIAVR